MSNSLSTVKPQAPWLNKAAPGLLAGAGALGIAAINPTDSGVSICFSQRLAGLDCPLCGGLRCVNSLMRADFLAAADHNLIVTVALPVIAVAWIVWFIGSMRGRPVTFKAPPNWVIGLGAVIVLAFSVARNIGGPAWIDWLASGAFV